MTLLTLPTELLIHTLTFLPLPDLLSCKRVNRFIHSVVAQSVLLQYVIEAKAAGVEDNPRSTLTVSDRLALLRRREAAWAKFKINFHIRMPPLGQRPSGIYDLTGGVYLQGQAASSQTAGQQITTALNYVHLPSESQDTSWSKISICRDIVDIGLAMQEHNLIAVVTAYVTRCI
jgi:F-box domain